MLGFRVGEGRGGAGGLEKEGKRDIHRRVPSATTMIHMTKKNGTIMTDP